ncbi:hypothetical protein DFA_05489 [Cavenderia fasciculata]|uniref:Uncharacterized protein n=1 Tax=Cavenderia fasciculata TaxID=261658 RepID=F4PLD5_CACFS|nr:uncharacterized protein DFA_05489 [Cavenderia fasciculata]EGG23357.1 hypothetical protein DFA_05489 [Cavenderia fasciculata]|eukprot:XP_004361208.1 hypothetical protein DFA_05489 [Cavenderia fasciculata]
MSHYNNATINPNFKWVGVGLSFLRQCSNTYGVFDDVPPLTNPQVVDLLEVASPTSCYVLDESYNQRAEGENPQGTFDVGPATAYFDGQTIQMKPFYDDQQSCVSWYVGSNGKVYFAASSWTFTYCASSLAEFTTRVSIESALWSMASSRKRIQENKKKFTPEQLEYIDYYLAKIPPPPPPKEAKKPQPNPTINDP